MEGWIGPGTTQAPVASVGQLRGSQSPGPNTLLLSSRQIIGLTLTPDDLKAAPDGERLAREAEREAEFGNRPTEYARSLGMRFITIYAKYWEEMMAVLATQPLADVLSQRVNFGLPYDRIAQVEVKRIVNTGLRFHLTDDTTVRFLTVKIDQLPGAAATLAKHVSVK